MPASKFGEIDACPKSDICQKFTKVDYCPKLDEMVTNPVCGKFLAFSPIRRIRLLSKMFEKYSFVSNIFKLVTCLKIWQLWHFLTTKIRFGWLLTKIRFWQYATFKVALNLFKVDVCPKVGQNYPEHLILIRSVSINFLSCILSWSVQLSLFPTSSLFRSLSHSRHAIFPSISN